MKAVFVHHTEKLPGRGFFSHYYVNLFTGQKCFILHCLLSQAKHQTPDLVSILLKSCPLMLTAVTLAGWSCHHLWYKQQINNHVLKKGLFRHWASGITNHTRTNQIICTVGVGEWEKFSYCTRDTLQGFKKNLNSSVQFWQAALKFSLLWVGLSDLLGSKIHMSWTTGQHFSQALHCQGEIKGTCRCLGEGWFWAENMSTCIPNLQNIMTEENNNKGDNACMKTYC